MLVRTYFLGICFWCWPTFLGSDLWQIMAIDAPGGTRRFQSGSRPYQLHVGSIGIYRRLSSQKQGALLIRYVTTLRILTSSSVSPSSASPSSVMSATPIRLENWLQPHAARRSVSYQGGYFFSLYIAIYGALATIKEWYVMCR